MRILLPAALGVATLASGCGGETCWDGSKPVGGECPCTEDATVYPADHDGECPCDDAGHYSGDEECVECDLGENSEGGCRVACWDGDVADFEEDCAFLLEPVAVGFEFDGAVIDGELSGWYTDLESDEIPPLVIVTFADQDFFSLSGDAQEGHYCSALALAGDVYGESVLVQDPSETHDTVWEQWEMALSIAPGTWDYADDPNSCAFHLDPEEWGDGGQDILEAFQGIRFGMGFGPRTDYLTDAWSEETITDYGDYMMAEYIAVNDANGDWYAYDWTTAFVFEINTDLTLATEINEDDVEVLIYQDVSSAMPTNSYIRSQAYWYQDFPLMDFSNLSDGAPTESTAR